MELDTKGAERSSGLTCGAHRMLTQPSTDNRVKHLADIANSDLWDGIDCRQVAAELTRTCKSRGIPLSVCAERAPALAWTAVSAREAEWAKHMTAGKTTITLDRAWLDVCAVWAEVHKELRSAVILDFRRPHSQTPLADQLLARCEQNQMAYKPQHGE